jgi:hypothetical protein
VIHILSLLGLLAYIFLIARVLSCWSVNSCNVSYVISFPINKIVCLRTLRPLLWYQSSSNAAELKKRFVDRRKRSLRCRPRKVGAYSVSKSVSYCSNFFKKKEKKLFFFQFSVIRLRKIVSGIVISCCKRTHYCP